MAAGLATKTNGEAALWLNGKPGWHNLGKVWDPKVDGEVTVERVMQEAGLDHEVIKVPLFAGATEDSVMGTQRVKRGHTFATVRNDTGAQLGTVGNVYKPFQNRQAFSFLENITGQGAAYIESAGLLAEGSRAFVSMVLGDDLVLDPKGVADRVRKYVLVTNAHDGTGKVTGAVTPVRTVCANTLRYGLQVADARIDVRHTEGGLARLDQTAAEVLGIAVNYYDEFEADATALFGAKMAKREFEKFLEEVAFPIKATMGDREKENRLRDRGRALTLWTEAKTMEGVRGTRWGALQALTQELEHREGRQIPASLGLDVAAPKSLREDIARGARVVKGTDDERRTQLHRALLTWKR